jgi:5-methylcytosine-specific restriction endonuclease McrA
MVILRRDLYTQMDASWRTRYRAYLESAAWEKRRALVLERAGHRCEVCGAEPPLHVHHLTYERCFREPLSDLKAVCPECHVIADLQRRSLVEDEARRRRLKRKYKRW